MLEQAIDYGMGMLGLQDSCLDIYLEDNFYLCGEFLGDDESMEIIINADMRLKDQIITLFHELVHAQQCKENRMLCEDEAYTKEKILYADFLLTLVVK